MKLHRNKAGDVRRVKDIPLESIVRYRGRAWTLIAHVKPEGKRPRAWLSEERRTRASGFRTIAIHGNTGVIDTHLW
jgi:hypothetical protein